MDKAIEIKNLCKAYKGFSLDNVSFDVPSGSIMGFVGENGAGKTTTIKSMLNIVRPDSGEIKLLDKEMRYGEKPITDIGVVLDGSFFYEKINAGDIGSIMRSAYKSWDADYYKTMLLRFNLPASKSMKEYSKGMRAKLCLLVALAHHPRLLVLDEATSGLDPMVRGDMLDVFLEFISDESHAILMSSHITADIEKVADYITFIHEGRVVFSSAKDEVMEKYAIVKCSAATARLIPAHIVAGRRDSSVDTQLLINDVKELRAFTNQIVIDKASIDDIMTFIAKGEQSC